MPDDKRIARIVNGKIVYGSHAQVIKPNEMAANERRQRMRTDRRKEMLQRNQVDYYKAYPEQAKNLSDETRRLLS